MPSCHVVGTAGKAVAILCAIHCAIFVLLFAVAGLQVLPISAEFLWWFDNLWIHLGAATLAFLLGSFHLLLHRRHVGVRAIMLFAGGAALLTGSITWESELHEHGECALDGDNVSLVGDATEPAHAHQLAHRHAHHHEHENCEHHGHAHHHYHAEEGTHAEGEQHVHDEVHLHSPVPHLVFMAGNLCMLLLHAGVGKCRGHEAEGAAV